MLEGVTTVLAADHATDVAYWRARAERAEELVAELGSRAAQAEARAERAEARAGELGEQVAVLSRMLFGPSSEKERKHRPAPGEAGQAGQAGGGRGERRRGRRPGSPTRPRRDYSGLETREVVHDVPPEERVCPACGTEFEFLGGEAGEQVDWHVKITRIVHRRLRYRRRCTCPGPRTVTAPAPPRPIPGGRFTAAFLARLLVERHVLGRPLHRIAAALAADGFGVAEGTLCGALEKVSELLAPLAQAVAVRNAEAAHLHADETSWRVFEQVEGKDSHRWWLWVFLAPDTTVFTMDPTRSAAVLRRHLGVGEDEDGHRVLPEGRHLLLSADFYTVYQSLGRIDGIDPLWCWAHVRRYFVRAGDAHPQLRYWRDLWLRRIGELYLAHRTLAAAEPGTDAHTRAQAAFEAALETIDTARHRDEAIFSLHPAAREVLATLDREWDGLARHRAFPGLDLDNNAAERALRNPVVGRKNYYGSQAAWSAHLAARVWTVTATAERNGHDPLPYLTDYLDACAANGGKPPEGPALERFFVWRHDSHGDTAGDHGDDPDAVALP